MKLDLDRRTVLKWMGVQVALPLLGNVLPRSARAAQIRKRFIAVYTPNGAYMPGGQDGTWNWAEALQPLVGAGFQPNTMVLRGMFNGFPGIDPHWQNATGFLSCKKIVLGDSAVARCAKTLDQYVADAYPAQWRSLEVGAPYYHVHPLADHPGYSNDYLNRISWQTDDKFRSPIADPRQMFQRLFGTVSGGAAQINFLHARRKSVLDQVYKDANRLAARMTAEYGPVLSTYMDSVRELEMQLDAPPANNCQRTLMSPTQDFGDPQLNYLARYQLMHEMIALAMQCGSTNVATFMYGPSSSNITFVESLGDGPTHHASAHNRGDPNLIDRLKRMTLLETGLLADLLQRLKSKSLLQDTLVLYGSDMSDGDAHNTSNIPVLLCGSGSDLKFGQEIGSAAMPRPLSDLHMDIFQLLGITSVTSFGEEGMASTGQPLPIRV